VRRISIDCNGQLAFRVSSLFVYKVITLHGGKKKTNSNLEARIVELDEREEIGRNGSLVNSQLNSAGKGKWNNVVSVRQQCSGRSLQP
jgi:hypothetical protein